MGQNKFRACAPPSCSCPEIEIVDNQINIRDDFGHEVWMTIKEFEMMIDWYKKENS